MAFPASSMELDSRLKESSEAGNSLKWRKVEGDPRAAKHRECLSKVDDHSQTAEISVTNFPHL